MDKYIELPRENIKFCGNTEEEKKTNELIFDLTLENDSLHQENQQLKEQIQQRDEVIEEIIKYIDDNSHYYSTDTKEILFTIEEEKEETFCKDIVIILNNYKIKMRRKDEK